MTGTVLSLWLVGPGAAAGLVGCYGLMLGVDRGVRAALLACTLSVWLLVLPFAVPFAVLLAGAIRAYPTVRGPHAPTCGGA